jgi:ATP-dependent Clp protease protease subunit
MPKKTKLTDGELTEANLLSIIDPPTLPQMRAISLFGDLNEECIQDTCGSLLYLKHSCYEPRSHEEDEELIAKPIDFYISTWGGDALGMFAIYDLMRMIREECPIHTFAIGKVMSAGVLLLAAGTKGQRKIGKNTRIMMHSVRASHYGNIHSLENEMNETRWIQEQHINALVKETKLTRKKLNNMLNKKIDIYLSAEDAIKLGIADIIV